MVGMSCRREAGASPREREMKLIFERSVTSLFLGLAVSLPSMAVGFDRLICEDVALTLRRNGISLDRPEGATPVTVFFRLPDSEATRAFLSGASWVEWVMREEDPRRDQLREEGMRTETLWADMCLYEATPTKQDCILAVAREDGSALEDFGDLMILVETLSGPDCRLGG